MNFNKSSILLKKVQVLHDSAQAFGGKLSALEKDLMLHYLRELYIEISEDQITTAKPNAITEIKETPVVKPEPIPATTPVTVQAPRVEVTNYDLPPAQVVTSPPSPVATIQASQPPVVPVMDEAMALLFEKSEAQDQGSRFTNLPIGDIGKAMGINDRILTVNELFKGDQNKFNRVISDLNNARSYEEAKKYLIENIITTYDWTSPSKMGKAEVFIRLIRRKFL